MLLCKIILYDEHVYRVELGYEGTDACMKHLIIIRGGGEIATAIACRMHNSGYEVLLLEKARPSAIRREVSFADAVYEGEKTVERLTCYCAENVQTAEKLLRSKKITMLVDACGRYIKKFRPHILINTLNGDVEENRRPYKAEYVIGLGSGFCAHRDVDCVIETHRGHDLGRLIYEGHAQRNRNLKDLESETGCLFSAGAVGVIRSPRTISNVLRTGDIIAELYDEENGRNVEIRAPFPGVLRGLIHDGFRCLSKDILVAEIDSRNDPGICFSVSEKARCISGAVLEAVMAFEAGIRSANRTEI